MRSLAAEMGVSPMTVSLALRNSPSVSEAMRRRIQKLAKERGYRPDPVINRLMEHLRTREPARFRASICGLTDRWPADAKDAPLYRQRAVEGMKRRAQELGYAFDLVYFDEAGSGRSLQSMLFNRGVEGLVILPLIKPRSLTDHIDWSLFSVITVTSSVTQPLFHSVVPQHFDNMLLACRMLQEAGKRRIGLVLPKDWDIRVNFRWSGAIAWQNLYGGTGAVKPFIEQKPGLDLDQDALRQWFERESPQVILSDNIGQAALLRLSSALPKKRRPLLVSLNWTKADRGPGIDQRVEQIGGTAIDVLASLIMHSEKGVPTVPHTTMVMGEWIPRGLA